MGTPQGTGEIITGIRNNREYTDYKDDQTIGIPSFLTSCNKGD
ncbi:unnamed protein product, partial [marine sediment metagenome]